MFFEVLFGILGALFWLFGIPLILFGVVSYLVDLLEENELITQKAVEKFEDSHLLPFLLVSWLIFYSWFWGN